MPALTPSPPRAKPVDEKITINVGFVDLGQIDLLVQEGFYANRTDLIRTAIRNQLAAHADAVQAGGRRASTLVLGIQHFGAADLRGGARRAARSCEIRVLGLLSIAADVTPELALADDRIAHRARRAAREPGRQGRAGRPHRAERTALRRPP